MVLKCGFVQNFRETQNSRGLKKKFSSRVGKWKKINQNRRSISEKKVYGENEGDETAYQAGVFLRRTVRLKAKRSTGARRDGVFAIRRYTSYDWQNPT